MKKRLFILMMGLFLCVSVVSCGKSERNESELIASDTSYFIYKDLYFYSANTVENDRNTKTLKYINLATDDEIGSAVYGDVLEEGGDPFADPISSPMVLMVLVDEEATKQNNGIPVLIAACPVVVKSDDASPEWYYRLISFNMANNQIKVLCDNIGDGVWEIALYRDTIYCACFIGEFDNITLKATGERVIFSIPKSGGEPKKLPFPDLGTTFYFKCSYHEKLYIESYKENSVYRCDPDGQNAEKIYSFTEETEPLFYNNGYMYYKRNPGTAQKDGIDTKIFDLYRKPLEKLEELHQKEGELILEGVYQIDGHDGSEIYYVLPDDGNPFLDLPHDWSIVHYYNIETKEKGIVYDFSDKSGILWNDHINQKYIIIDSFTDEFETYWDTRVINRETGEHHNLIDVEW